MFFIPKFKAWVLGIRRHFFLILCRSQVPSVTLVRQTRFQGPLKDDPKNEVDLFTGKFRGKCTGKSNYLIKIVDPVNIPQNSDNKPSQK